MTTKTFIIYLSVMLSISFAGAQTADFETGHIRQSDLDYSVCPLDTAAGAVVLDDQGKSYFTNDGEELVIIYERYTKIKILKPSGVKWAQVEIPYYQSNDIIESVDNIQAISYNSGLGKYDIVKLNPDEIFMEKQSENWMAKKFAIPNVKAGTVIEYRYTIYSKYVFNLRDWSFQWKIPVLNSCYTVKMVPFYEYIYMLQEAKNFDEQTSEVDQLSDHRFAGVQYKDMVHTYVMKNQPPFNDEEFITTSNDYLKKIIFQLSRINFPAGYKKEIISTWPALSKDLLSDDTYGSYVAKWSKMAKDIFDPAKFATMSNLQKFDSVINYVKGSYRWNGEDRIYTTKTPKKMQADKIGASSDINLMAVGLLQGVGVKANPVLISTRDHGKIKLDYPFLSFFNSSVIVADIDGKLTLSDATDPFLSNNRLPLNCINEKGLIIEKNNSNWVNLPDKSLSRIKYTFMIDPAGESTVMVNAAEYDALELRKKFGNDKIALAKKLATQNYEVVDSVLNIKNINNLYQYKFKTAYRPDEINGKIYIAPFLNEEIKDNPFKQQSRTYPIDMIYARARTFNATIKIPDGYKLDFLPQNKKIQNPQFLLDYNVITTDDAVNIVLLYQLTEPVYQAADYAKLKAFYSELIHKMQEKIVLVKK